MLEKIYLANPRGFCAGVKYAITYVEQVQANSEEQIYVRKEIVHNRRVVEDMKKLESVLSTIWTRRPTGPRSFLQHTEFHLLLWKRLNRGV